MKAVAFSPNEAMLATAAGSQISLWDMRTHALIRTLVTPEMHVRVVTRVLWSPDGTTIAASVGAPYRGGFGYSAGRVLLWDAATGALKRTLEHPNGVDVESLAYSPDGRWIASGSQGQSSVCVWEAGTGALRHTFPMGGVVWSVAFSPDSKSIAAGSSGKHAIVWDVATGRQKHLFDAHDHLVLSVAFSRDGRTLATGSYDETLRLWDLRSSRLTHRVPMGGWVHALEFSPSGKSLAIGLRAKQGALRLWELPLGP